jgi:hypothetical protein
MSVPQIPAPNLVTDLFYAQKGGALCKGSGTRFYFDEVVRKWGWRRGGFPPGGNEVDETGSIESVEAADADWGVPDGLS